MGPSCPPPLLSTSAIGYTLHQRKSLDTDFFLLLADSFDFENLYDRILLPFNYSQLKQDSFNGEFFSEKILLATSFRFVDRTALSLHRYIQYVFILCHTQMWLAYSFIRKSIPDGISRKRERLVFKTGVIMYILNNSYKN